VKRTGPSRHRKFDALFAEAFADGEARRKGDEDARREILQELEEQARQGRPAPPITKQPIVIPKHAFSAMNDPELIAMTESMDFKYKETLPWTTWTYGMHAGVLASFAAVGTLNRVYRLCKWIQSMPVFNICAGYALKHVWNRTWEWSRVPTIRDTGVAYLQKSSETIQFFETRNAAPLMTTGWQMATAQEIRGDIKTWVGKLAMWTLGTAAFAGALYGLHQLSIWLGSKYRYRVPFALKHEYHRFTAEEVIDMRHVDLRAKANSLGDMEYQPVYAVVKYRRSMKNDHKKIHYQQYLMVDMESVSHMLAARYMDLESRTDPVTVRKRMGIANGRSNFVNHNRYLRFGTTNRRLINYFGTSGYNVPEESLILAINRYKKMLQDTKHLPF
jgi:hypothetical protein